MTPPSAFLLAAAAAIIPLPSYGHKPDDALPITHGGLCLNVTQCSIWVNWDVWEDANIPRTASLAWRVSLLDPDHGWVINSKCIPYGAPPQAGFMLKELQRSRRNNRYVIEVEALHGEWQTVEAYGRPSEDVFECHSHNHANSKRRISTGYVGLDGCLDGAIREAPPFGPCEQCAHGRESEALICAEDACPDGQRRPLPFGACETDYGLRVPLTHGWRPRRAGDGPAACSHLRELTPEQTHCGDPPPPPEPPPPPAHDDGSEMLTHHPSELCLNVTKCGIWAAWREGGSKPANGAYKPAWRVTVRDPSTNLNPEIAQQCVQYSDMKDDRWMRGFKKEDLIAPRRGNEYVIEVEAVHEGDWLGQKGCHTHGHVDSSISMSTSYAIDGCLGGTSRPWPFGLCEYCRHGRPGKHEPCADEPCPKGEIRPLPYGKCQEDDGWRIPLTQEPEDGTNGWRPNKPWRTAKYLCDDLGPPTKSLCDGGDVDEDPGGTGGGE